jgi:sn-glycerol 3-phosphate transport system permease protein
VRHIYGWLLLLPALVLLVTFAHYPAIASLINSLFSNGTVIRPRKFVGIENYQYMLQDTVFLTTIKNTALFALGTVPLSIAIALGMALWVNQKLLGRAWVRLSFFTPTILPMIAAANIWLFFYTPEIGLFNTLLGWFGIGGINWLGESKTVLASLMAMTIWKEAGFFMIFYLAALQTLPKELKEAAIIEGASSWTYFWKIAFPLLMPTTLFVLINAFLNAFKLVDHLFILTKGGPNNASNLLLYYIYEVAFSFFDRAYASTLTMVLLIILVLLSLLQFGFVERKTHYR